MSGKPVFQRDDEAGVRRLAASLTPQERAKIYREERKVKVSAGVKAVGVVAAGFAIFALAAVAVAIAFGLYQWMG